MGVFVTRICYRDELTGSCKFQVKKLFNLDVLLKKFGNRIQRRIVGIGYVLGLSSSCTDKTSLYEFRNIIRAISQKAHAPVFVR